MTGEQEVLSFRDGEEKLLSQEESQIHRVVSLEVVKKIIPMRLLPRSLYLFATPWAKHAAMFPISKIFKTLSLPGNWNFSLPARLRSTILYPYQVDKKKGKKGTSMKLV